MLWSDNNCVFIITAAKMLMSPYRAWSGSYFRTCHFLHFSSHYYETCLFVQGFATDMLPPARQDYVSISFTGQASGSYNNGKQWRRQSCWRVSGSHFSSQPDKGAPFICPIFTSALLAMVSGFSPLYWKAAVVPMMEKLYPGLYHAINGI